MNEKTTFDHLIRELPSEERDDLLERIRQEVTVKIKQEPLWEGKKMPGIAVEAEYARQPWYYHLRLFIMSLFSAKSPVALYREQEITKLGRSIAEQAPEMYDLSRHVLRAGFYQELVNLKKGARFFYDALDVILGRNRGAFYAFLGSLHMEDIHTRLVSGTDPAVIAAANPRITLTELCHIACRNVEDTTDLIDETEQRAMYEDIRFLQCLKQLASFPFDQVIQAFKRDPVAGGEMTCPAAPVRDTLSQLNDILFSFKKNPPLSLLEALFVFMLQERMREQGVDTAGEIWKLLAGAERSLEAVRKFNRTTHLTLLLRYAFGDLSLSPVVLSGGGEWVPIYREYWKGPVKERCAEYLRTTCSRELQESFLSFFKGSTLSVLKHAGSPDVPEGIPVHKTEAVSLEFLKTYRARVFTRDAAAVLNTILTNGEFYDWNSHFDFLSVYNWLDNLEGAVDTFEHRISPIGDFGIRYAAAQKGMGSLAFKRRRAQGVITEVNEEALRIIEQGKTALVGLVDLLNGIMKKETANTYGGLINFYKLADRGGVFMKHLSAAAQNARTALKMLEEIEHLEREGEGGQVISNR
jgi:hypothetical protein